MDAPSTSSAHPKAQVDPNFSATAQPLKSHSSALAPYFSRTRGDIRPGVFRMRRLLEACGLPFLSSKPRVLVTGTNGKGTTCAFLESALRQAGFKTGLYTSPHLVHPGERVRISGIPATEEQLERLVSKADAASQHALPDATFFELLTAVAFVAFEEAGTDIDVVEVGLGGRFDSTNVLPPTVSILTSVGLDHTEFLGPTTEAIASDKAWISRRSRPFVAGDLDDGATKGVSATLLRTGGLLIDSRDKNVLGERGLALVKASGRRLDVNLACAIAGLFALEKETGVSFADGALAQGLQSAFWPGRFDSRQVQGVEVIFDAAHNAHGFSYFENQWRLRKGSTERPIVVYGSLSDKNWSEIVANLGGFGRHIVFTSPHSPRAVPAETLASTYASLPAHSTHPSQATCETEPTLAEALLKALAAARRDGLPCVVIGSIALIGEAMERLEVNPFDAQR